MKETIKLYRRLLGEILPYRKVAMLSLLALIITAALEPVFPALFKPLIDKAVIAKDPHVQWQIPMFLVLIALAKGVMDYLAKVASEWVANKAITNLRNRVFEHQMYLPIVEHHRQTSGRMLSRILYDVAQVGQTLTYAWVIVIKDSLVIIGLLFYLFWSAWQLTLLILLVAPVMLFLVRYASKKLRGSNTEIQNSTGKLSSAIEESLQGIRELKIYAAYEQEQKKFAFLSNELRRHTMRTVRVAATNVPLVQFIATLAVATTLYVAGGLLTDNKMSAGGFVAFIIAMGMLFEPIRRLTTINEVIQRGLAAATSIYGLLDLEPEPLDHRNTEAVSKGEIEFRNVSFAYPGQEQEVLQKFSLCINARETIALVGSSGSGKTTIINLLANFYSDYDGDILFDGRNSRDMDIRAVRQGIALVSQHPILFNGSIIENICYGQSNIDVVRATAAAEKAYVMEFAREMPDGLDSQVGENAGSLSGGQRQRIAIARAFYKQAPILLFDEATSALDNHSEAMVKSALQEAAQKSTTIIVAHRLSTVRNADRILVMHDGAIVESGSHDELVAAQGQYYRLLQTS